MYQNVSRTEIKYIKQMAGRGMEAQAIATQLKIHLPRVETFMPKDPEIEEKEAKERAKARAKTKAAEGKAAAAEVAEVAEAKPEPKTKKKAAPKKKAQSKK